jgi:putative ABC transport system permease protein
MLLILRALRHNRLGALLISMQIALTLAIVCNSLSLIQEYIRHMRTPSGVDEANILAISNAWVGQPSDLAARIATDLTALRSLPGVIDAEATNSYPLGGSGWGVGISLKPGQAQPTASISAYLVDEHGLATYGVKLIAGRWFTKAEIADMRVNEMGMDRRISPPSVVMTRRLAAKLFPGGDGLGQLVYIDPQAPTRIIGVVERAGAPGVSWDEGTVDNSAFLPYRYSNGELYYLIRTLPGALAKISRSVPDTLYAKSRQRIIQYVSTFGQVRQKAYRSEHSLSVTLAILCALLLVVTACGIVGLTMYWVAQRRRQIGMRRALGARRIDILRYFHTENLLISGGGVVLGIAAGLVGNIWLASTLTLTRMSAGYIGAGAVIVLGLCQAAVLWPALRAASIPPASAIRNL